MLAPWTDSEANKFRYKNKFVIKPAENDIVYNELKSRITPKSALRFLLEKCSQKSLIKKT